MNARKQQPHAAYLHLDASGAVIYAGCTLSSYFSHRMAQHRHRTEHWPEVAEVVIESVMPTFIAGRLREALLIAEHSPRYNVRHPSVTKWHALRTIEGITAEEEAACVGYLVETRATVMARLIAFRDSRESAA